MFIRLFIAIVLLGVIFGGLFGWKFHQFGQMAANMPGPPPATVATTVSSREAWRPTLRAVGTLTAYQGIEITNQVPGVIETIGFRSGQAVAQGDELLRLDDEVDQAELRGLEAERDLARIKFNRLSTLVKDRSVSQSDVDEARAQLDSARARVSAQRALIAKKTITAPFAGQLGIRDIDLGDYLPAGSPIVSLQQLDPIYVDFTLPERHLSRVRTGQAITVSTAAYPDEPFSGEIAVIDPGLDVQTRSLQLRASLANPDGHLRPGMFAEVEVLLPAREDVLTLPAVTVSFNPYGDFVYIAEADDAGGLTAQRRQITIGETDGERVEVISGLSGDEQIVIAGQVKLRNGQALSIDNEVLPTPDQAASIGR